MFTNIYLIYPQCAPVAGKLLYLITLMPNKTKNQSDNVHKRNNVQKIFDVQFENRTSMFWDICHLNIK